MLQEPCSNRQADAWVIEGHAVSAKPGTDSLKTLQQLKLKKKEKQSRKSKWSGGSRLNPLLPSGDGKGGYVFTEEMLQLPPVAKALAIGPDDPLGKKHCFYCMLCWQKISTRTRGLYDLKRHLQLHYHFQPDQRLRENHCPWKVCDREVRDLFGSKSEAEREPFMELYVPDLD